MVGIDDIRNNEDVKTYIRQADESLVALGFTEHSFPHVTRVSETAKYILETLDYPQHDVELVQIAAYLHDIGNVVNRIEHSQSGAVMAFRILDKLGMPSKDIATVITAIGNHDESTGNPEDIVSAALIIADKTDVRRSRVRQKEKAAFDIHDRVNYAVTESTLKISPEKKLISLNLQIDEGICTMYDYFDIFLGRMQMCRHAAELFGARFKLTANGSKVL